MHSEDVALCAWESCSLDSPAAQRGSVPLCCDLLIKIHLLYIHHALVSHYLDCPPSPLPSTPFSHNYTHTHLLPINKSIKPCTCTDWWRTSYGDLSVGRIAEVVCWWSLWVNVAYIQYKWSLEQSCKGGGKPIHMFADFSWLENHHIVVLLTSMQSTGFPPCPAAYRSVINKVLYLSHPNTSPALQGWGDGGRGGRRTTNQWIEFMSVFK